MEDVVKLSQEFGFEEREIARLSSEVAIGLSHKLALPQLDLQGSRTESGVREAKKAVKALQNAEKKLKEAQSALHGIRFKNMFSHNGMQNPADDRVAAFNRSVAVISEFRAFVETMSQHEDTFFEGTPDERRTRDERRHLICTQIFNFWVRNGQKLTYTTSPGTSEREGPLISFVNSVVMCLTEPPSRIPGETIKMERDAFLSFGSGDCST